LLREISDYCFVPKLLLFLLFEQSPFETIDEKLPSNILYTPYNLSNVGALLEISVCKFIEKKKLSK
jgi:hypothetical protein